MASDVPSTKELQHIVERLERRTAEIDLMDKKIALSFKEDTDITTAMEEILQYNDERSRWKIEIKAFLEGITKPPVSQFHLGTQSVPNILNSSINTTYRAVQLSKLTIKPFRGDPLDWLTFWDGFSTSIHENAEMSNIDKMKFSCSYLIGDAAKAIAGLPLSNGKYNRAVELLKQRSHTNNNQLMYGCIN